MVRMSTNGHEGERLTAVLSSCRQYFNNRETPSTDSLIKVIFVKPSSAIFVLVFHKSGHVKNTSEKQWLICKAHV